MKLIFLGALLFLTPADAYKFLCNGITAEGVTESDSCGVCSDSTGPRWPNASVAINVNTSVLPAGISGTDWKNLATDCFNTWARTPGVQLTTSYLGEGVRSFGTDSKNHDIFWVTSSSEWADQVGAAPNGILGVTLPPYVCPSKTVGYRTIGDADMILNAVPSAGFPWALSCPGLSDTCQSVRATLQHESGHFLGLGHPCVDCQAMMSATVAFLIEYPLFDDQAGLRALYSGSGAGSFATSCSSTAPCQSGLSCHTQSLAQYCSHSCTLSADCENHMTCNNGMCEFPGGAALGAVSLYGDCTGNLSCDTGLICVHVSDTAGYCFNSCTGTGNGDGICQASETCHQLHNSKKVAIKSWACMRLVDQNASCGVLAGVPIACKTSCVNHLSRYASHLSTSTTIASYLSLIPGRGMMCCRRDDSH